LRGVVMSLREAWAADDALLAAPAEPVSLRPYQVEAIARIDDCIARGVRRLIVQLATGAGAHRLGDDLRVSSSEQAGDLHGAGD
jgi:hypothetical protein